MSVYVLCVCVYVVCVSTCCVCVSSWPPYAGALFACVAFVESLSGNVAFAVFSSLYAATVAWYPGFSFLLASGLCFVPMALLG